ncbi:DNA-binding protein [Zancudomyces culisetae]|uniref:DNA-binding protein n=1 Tax=Zancudomyces culisetae TaxID=1213189 RepID=A0A1R1PSK1_ZANCU|nr:DNA-binding protein [Zancudomyces culisetae]|eukprot:OMH83938.1 DNA-binding protein [Zancudomyces culisetae]
MPPGSYNIERLGLQFGSLGLGKTEEKQQSAVEKAEEKKPVTTQGPLAQFAAAQAQAQAAQAQAQTQSQAAQSQPGSAMPQGPLPNDFGTAMLYGMEAQRAAAAAAAAAAAMMGNYYPNYESFSSNSKDSSQQNNTSPYPQGFLPSYQNPFYNPYYYGMNLLQPNNNYSQPFKQNMYPPIYNYQQQQQQYQQQFSKPQKQQQPQPQQSQQPQQQPQQQQPQQQQQQQPQQQSQQPQQQQQQPQQQQQSQQHHHHQHQQHQQHQHHQQHQRQQQHQHQQYGSYGLHSQAYDSDLSSSQPYPFLFSSSAKQQQQPLDQSQKSLPIPPPHNPNPNPNPNPQNPAKPEGSSGPTPQDHENELRRAEVLSTILTTEARERLGRIALVKPAKAKQIEDLILSIIQKRGGIGGMRGAKVTESELISLLNQINAASEPSHTHTSTSTTSHTHTAATAATATSKILGSAGTGSIVFNRKTFGDDSESDFNPDDYDL